MRDQTQTKNKSERNVIITGFNLPFLVEMFGSRELGQPNLSTSVNYMRVNTYANHCTVGKEGIPTLTLVDPWWDNCLTTSPRRHIMKNSSHADIGPIGRFPEGPMMYATAGIKGKDCSYIYQYLYNMKDGPFIKHLDGRKNTSYRH